MKEGNIMKKLIVALTVMGIMVGSLAAICVADENNKYYKEVGPNVSNRHNGSYYYDVGWSNVTPKPGYKCRVSVYLKKNGTWQAGKTTNVPKNSSITCYSQKLEGSGSTAAASFFAVYNA
jgi:hypothetical protein